MLVFFSYKSCIGIAENSIGCSCRFTGCTARTARTRIVLAIAHILKGGAAFHTEIFRNKH